MNGSRDFVRFLLPVAVLAAGIAMWELVIRINDIQPYVLPVPVAVLQTLVSDWQVLSESLGVTCRITAYGNSEYSSHLD